MHWILQKLLGLDPSVLKPGAEWSFDMRAAWAGALWVVLLALVGALIYSVVIYRKEGRPIGAGFRALLAALRVLVLSLLIILLCEPILAVEEVEYSKPYVIFMIDTSQSMNLHDRFPEEEEKDAAGKPVRKSDVQRARDALPAEYVSPDGVARKDMGRDDLAKLSRMDFVNAVLTGKDTDPRKTPLGGRYNLRFYDVNNDIHPEYARSPGGEPPPGEAVAPGGSLADRPGSHETRLGDCTRKVLNDLRGQTVVGMVMLTDGRNNAGDDPREVARLAQRRNVPIYTVGVGDRRIMDLEVRRIEAPERAYAGDFVKFSATLVQKGFAGHKANVVLRRGKEVLDTKRDVALPEDGKAFQVELRFKPKEEEKGKADYTVEVEGKTGELVSDNNSLTHTMTVIEGKIKVLYVEGQDLPRYEYRFLKHAMMRDHTLQVTTLLAQGDGTFFYDGNYPIDAYPKTEQEMFDKYDVIIFGDVNPEIFSEDQLKLTQKFVGEHGGGFMMIAGERFAPMDYVGDPIKKPISPLIPVIVDRSDVAFISMTGRTITESFKPKVTQQGWQSPILRLETDEPANQALWNKVETEGGLPGFFWYLPVAKAKSTASVLLVRPADPGDRQDSKERPLVVTEHYGRGLTMFVGTDEFWRWRFARGDRHFYRFYAQAIQYLASARGGQTRTSVLATDWPVYSLGERVKFTAEVKTLSGSEYKPYEAESVDLHYSQEGGGEMPVVKLAKVPGSPGQFSGYVMPKGRGKFHAWLPPLGAVGERGGECDFEVKLPQLEYEDPRMDETLLQEVSERGGAGGKFLQLDEIDQLDHLITEPERKNPVRREHPLWDNWRLFALFTLVIVAEWVLRKRARML